MDTIVDKLFAVTKRLIYMSFLRERVWISIYNDLGISTAVFQDFEDDSVSLNDSA
jgi:hypothetical protein